VGIIASFLIAYFLRGQLYRFGMDSLAGFSSYFPYMLWILVIWLCLLRLLDCYSLNQTQGPIFISRSKLFLKLILVEILGTAIIASVFFFLKEAVSRSFLLSFGIINLLSLNFVKLIVSVFFVNVNRNKKYHRKVLIVGNKDMVSQFSSIQETMPELFIDADINQEFLFKVNQEMGAAEWRQLNDKIIKYILQNVIDEVLLVFHNINLSFVSPLINDCRHLGIMVNITLDISELIYPKTEMDKIGSFNIVSFQSYDYSPVQRFIKAIMDLAGGLVGTVIFAVAYPFIAILIKTTSPGPVLFTQTRKGKNGREFKLYKFRTMYADAEERKKDFLSRNEMKGQIFKLKDDPRVTPLGKFLRFTSLDELPQFINILRGNMSLVGTRPPTVEEFDAYEKRHRRRLSIRPGLTGLWQVSGRNEISDFEDIVKLDTKYIDTWSIWLDIKIILKTFIVLFKGR
jgi:exopolysaccharide biosynthesis polyprenyl glycosylphosphotransferase